MAKTFDLLGIGPLDRRMWYEIGIFSGRRNHYVIVREADSMVQLKNEITSFDMLFNAVSSFYQRDGSRIILIFEERHPDHDTGLGYFVRFLLDRKHVVEYRIANDRGLFLSILSLAIGPHYFPPADFWDYENSQRFSLEASTEAIVHNLKLLDEFLARH